MRWENRRGIGGGESGGEKGVANPGGPWWRTAAEVDGTDVVSALHPKP